MSSPSSSPRPPSSLSTRAHQLRHGALGDDQSEMTIKNSRFVKCMQQVPLNSIMVVVVTVNVIQMWVQFEYEGYKVGVQIGLQPSGRWGDLDELFHVLQSFFAVVYLVDLAIRVTMHGTRFWYRSGRAEKFNIFDTLVVLVTAFDALVLENLGVTNASRQATSLARIFYLAKIARTARIFFIVRTLKMYTFFGNLNDFVTVATAAMPALFWSLVVIWVSMICAAMVLTVTLTDFLAGDPDIDDELQGWIFHNYGTTTRAFYTVFELTFSGGWPGFSRKLVDHVSPWYGPFFIVYITLIVFAAFRLVTMLFLRDVMAAMNNDSEHAITSKLKEKAGYAQKVLDLFHAADRRSDGLLSIQEFESSLQDPRLLAYLSHLEVDAGECIHLFRLIDNGTASSQTTSSFKE
mmetsp:Transcript_58836/g.190484  ORF Transcript_58836/g.190484 Transcript_58836/m.190484 type:complete len:405 (+) Transcript_58836:94-1308(+)